MIKKGDTIPGIFSLAVGILTMVYIILNPKMIIMGEKANGGVGPAFFPFLCGVALIVCGILLIIRGIKQNGTVDYFALTSEKRKNLKVVGMLVLFCAIMLGSWKISKIFFLCLPIYCFVINKLLKRSTKFSVIFSIVVTAFIYLLFRVCFTIRFMP